MALGPDGEVPSDALPPSKLEELLDHQIYHEAGAQLKEVFEPLRRDDQVMKDELLAKLAKLLAPTAEV